MPNTGAFELPGGLTDPRSQIGPMSRWVEDLGPVLAIIAGVDWRDSGVIPMPLADPTSVELRGLRVACYADDGMAPPTAETSQAVRDAARALADAGAVVEETRPPDLDQGWDITQRYWRSAELTGKEIERLMLDWDGFRTAMLGFVERYDLILCPVADEPAVPLGGGGQWQLLPALQPDRVSLRRGAGRDVARGPADRRAGGGPAVAGGRGAGGGAADRNGPRWLETASALNAGNWKPAARRRGCGSVKNGQSGSIRADRLHPRAARADSHHPTRPPR